MDDFVCMTKVSIFAALVCFLRVHRLEVDLGDVARE